MLYSQTDYDRESGEKDDQPWRSAFGRDYGRIIHSASFRRLQGKTQVFPGHESDFFRNRLTHSLEVAQIAEGIADRLNHQAPPIKKLGDGNGISSRLCAAASLIHDLGHPPFGHNGERALDDAMRKHGGFEGNAQTLRIVSRLEKKSKDAEGNIYGLGLTYRTLGAVLKYDRKISRSRRENAKFEKGYYLSEADLVKKIKVAIAGSVGGSIKNFKTIECYIMDIADDIAYSTYDLEDSLKAGFLTPSEILASNSILLIEVAKKVESELGYSFTAKEVIDTFAGIFSIPREQNSDQVIFVTGDDIQRKQLEDFVDLYRAHKKIAESGYLRTQLSSELVKKAIDSVNIEYNDDFPMLSKVFLSKEGRRRVEVLKQYTYISTIYSSRVKLPEFRGYEVVRGIFDSLASEKGFLLLPEDVRDIYRQANGDMDTQMRVICDFVAGMTDRYAIEFYGRLHSDSAQSMFKPI